MRQLPMTVVDKFCGAAVLRGAHVFASGILCQAPGKISKYLCCQIEFHDFCNGYYETIR